VILPPLVFPDIYVCVCVCVYVCVRVCVCVCVCVYILYNWEVLEIKYLMTTPTPPSKQGSQLMFIPHQQLFCLVVLSTHPIKLLNRWVVSASLSIKFDR